MISPPVSCPFPVPQYWLFSENVPQLVYYSHFLSICAALLAAVLVLLAGRKRLPNQILFLMLAPFILWVSLDSIFWAANNSDVIMFVWALCILFEPLVYLGALYLFYTLLKNKDVSFWQKIIFIIPYIPVIIAVSTSLALPGFDLSSCLSVEGFISIYYIYPLELFYAVVLGVLAFREYRASADRKRKKEIILLTFGTVFFLLAFSWGNIISSFTENWNFAQIGLFAMPVFIALLVYSIVRFHTFNIKLLGAQALVMGLIILIASQYFFIRNPINRVLTGVTLFFAATFGWWLARSVKREVRQKEELAVANAELQKLDQAKTLFLNIASHQLRTPLSGIKGFLAMILDGDFGEVSSKIKQILSELYANNNRLVRLVNTLLNVSRMESGRLSLMKAECDVVAVANHIVHELQFEAKDRGLTLSLETNHPKIIANIDADKIEDAFVNMIDNAIKYTAKGSVKARVMDQTDKIRFEVEDTGQGLKQSEIKTLFHKFVRGDRATQLHTDGTGIGLYLAKQIVDLHNGKIGVASPGVNKGSTFWFEVPK